MNRRDQVVDRRTRRDLEDLRARVPLRIVSGAGDRFNVVTNVRGGQTIWTSGASSLTGIKYPVTAISSVPSLDPTATSLGAMADGLGIGTMNGTTVYVCLKASDGTNTITDMISDLPLAITILSRTSIRLPVGSTADTATVYFPWKV